MKKLLLLLIAGFINLNVYAGVEIDSFAQSLNAYISEQSKTPDRIIRYADANGYLAKAALDPLWADKMTKELLADQTNAPSFQAALKLYSQVVQNYDAAFTKELGKYDTEYFDAYESMFRMMAGQNDNLKKVLEQLKNQTRNPTIPSAQQSMLPNMINMLESAQKMMPQVLVAMIADIQKKIDGGRFSREYRPQAEARLAILKSILPTSPLK